MTSRSTLGSQHQSLPRPQRQLSSGSALPPRPQAPARAHSIAQIQTALNAQRNKLQQQQQQQQDAVIDLTGEAEGKAQPRADDQPPRLPVSKSAPTPSLAIPGSSAQTHAAISPSGAVPPAQNDVSVRTARGKPQLYFEDGSGRVAGVASEGDGQGTPPSNKSTLIPFPPRPSQNAHDTAAALLSRVVGGAASAPRRDVKKNTNFDPPAVAIKFAQGKPADFTPWTSTGPEDTLNDHVLKNGWKDKVVVTHETNTGCPSMIKLLKNPGGLETLSSLFVSVLEKRQTLGRLIAPSTFKPPPRVTLTDTKREAWLRDLANPGVALRRLSRTIPHGIRGKVLLEQCASKKIPPARAVWLAKCVGANEMRAFKRKGASGSTGAGGELKWIREWTVHVEQFVETVIDQCGQDGWKVKMDYSIRLATHIYSEHLLDQDHFVSWILDSFEATQPDRLPIWLTLIGLYWKTLVVSRNRGYRLAECLLGHLDTVTQEGGEDINGPLIQRLQQLVTILAISHQGCLIIPRLWDKYRNVLSKIGDTKSAPDIRTSLAILKHRNERLLAVDRNVTASQHAPSRRILTILDSSHYHTSLEEISDKCLACRARPEELVSTLLHWSTTVYRAGTHRVYLAARLLRWWTASGIDTSAAIISFFGDTNKTESILERDLFRLVAELVRSKHFQVGLFLQSLVSRGLLAGSEGSTETCARYARFLANLPIHELPPHVTSLRDILLTNIGFSTENERRTIVAIQNHIIAQLPNLFPDHTGQRLVQEVPLGRLSITTKDEISRWLRQQVTTQRISSVKTVPIKPGESKDVEIYTSTISMDDFNIIRSILENMQDIAILADILSITATSENFSVLRSVADTLNYHHSTFDAIGALKSLFQKLVERFSSLRPHRAPDRPFCLALADLCHRVRGPIQLIHQLKIDLAKSEYRAGVAACSPASDGILEITQGKVDSDEEIERILNSGTTMDEGMMRMMFLRIISAIPSQAGVESLPEKHNFGHWLYRLRTFEDGKFDSLMAEWIASLLTKHDESTLLFVLPPLVSAGCLTLQALSSTARKIMDENASQREDQRRIALIILRAITPSLSTGDDQQAQDLYRFRIEQQKWCADARANVLPYLRVVLTLPAVGSEDESDGLTETLTAGPLLSMLHDLILQQPEAFASEIKSSDCIQDQDLAATIAHAKDLLDNILLPELRGLSLKDQVAHLIDAADHLSIPLCQMRLQWLLELNRDSTSETKEDIITTLVEALQAAMQKDQDAWVELVEGLDASIASMIREYAEHQILAAAAMLGKSTTATDTAEDEVMLRRYLQLVDATASSIPSEGQSGLAPVLTEKLRAVLEMLDPKEKDAQSEFLSSLTNTASSTPTLSAGEACSWIHAFLRLSILHNEVSAPSTPPTAVKQPTTSASTSGSTSSEHLGAFLSTLLALLTHPKLQPYPSVLEHVFDVACCVVTELPDDFTNRLARRENEKCRFDKRVLWLLGDTRGNEERGLGVVTNAPTSTNVPASISQGRNVSVSSPHHGRNVPQHRHSSSQQGAAVGGGKGQATSGPSAMGPPVPFTLRRWEVLPDPSSSAAGGKDVNETAVSLSLVGARRVV